MIIKFQREYILRLISITNTTKPTDEFQDTIDSVTYFVALVLDKIEQENSNSSYRSIIPKRLYYKLIKPIVTTKKYYIILLPICHLILM